MAEKIEDLTFDEMVEIAKEAILGLPASVATPAALAFRQIMHEQLADIIARGRIPELPPTW